jgi:cytochrome c-type biogenesis protein CcmH
MLAHLKDYTRSIGTKESASITAAGKLLPDVNSMIERLAARLETTPEDIKGWQMLGWSYFHTARYEQAATAFARAVELDPNSAELKLSYEEAKAKASESDNLETASSLQTEAVGMGGDRSSVEKNTKSEAMPPHEHDAAVRSMVDRLADRLESSPRDVDGWTLLMRSRVVRGEREIAATALRKALEVFKEDSAASREITAAAIELGLKTE